MSKPHVEGKVIRVTGHEVWVSVGEQTLPYLLRGRFRQKAQAIQVVAGDRVEVSPAASVGSPGAIEGLLPRESWLSRYAGGRDASEKVIVANIDVLFLIVSVRDPGILLGFVDRVLVAAEWGHNNVRICVNKTDLLTDEKEIESFWKTYSDVGYLLTRASATTGDGLDDIKSLLTGGVYAFVGQSGVGKSSLLNAIDKNLDLKVNKVAGKTGRGRHTTTFSQLYPMYGGYVADTPGMQTFGFPGNQPEQLSGCFPEFEPYESECRFQPCTHSHEPNCAVKDALDRDVIHQSRYKSYLSMLAEVGERNKR